MNVFELTRELIDIESISGNEEAVGNYLYACLEPLAARYGGTLERMDVEPRRFNVFALFGEPLTVTLSTHLDTVPPFIGSSEDDTHIWGRGACDTKGIIASMIAAANELLEGGQRGFGLLFVVGEERSSAGAYAAARSPRGSRYIVNGEPTENKLALGSKGALRYEVAAAGRMAHSAYPELGDSAIDKLLEALTRIKRISLPIDSLLGPSTLNIGTLAGGRAPNVIADEAHADIMEIPAVRLGSIEGIDTTVVAFTTDIPAFGGQWGEPFLIGPGSIHVAHTLEERVPKAELLEAVGIYKKMVRHLCKRESK
jgi:acetylornithine deacetylase